MRQVRYGCGRRDHSSPSRETAFPLFVTIDPIDAAERMLLLGIDNPRHLIDAARQLGVVEIREDAGAGLNAKASRSNRRLSSRAALSRALGRDLIRLLRLGMNPLNWKREHQLALAIAIVIGAVIGIVVGYFAYAAEYGIAATSFSNWVKGPFRYSTPRAFHLSHLLDLAALWWGLLGAAIGAGILYAGRLIST